MRFACLRCVTSCHLASQPHSRFHACCDWHSSIDTCLLSMHSVHIPTFVTPRYMLMSLAADCAAASGCQFGTRCIQFNWYRTTRTAGLLASSQHVQQAEPGVGGENHFPVKEYVRDFKEKHAELFKSRPAQCSNSGHQVQHHLHMHVKFCLSTALPACCSLVPINIFWQVSDCQVQEA